LVLAEIEFAEETTAIALPPFALREVTQEAFFAGGNLARLSQDMFQAGLQRHL
jgi:CYTH domain-containing protein